MESAKHPSRGGGGGGGIQLQGDTSPYSLGRGSEGVAFLHSGCMQGERYIGACHLHVCPCLIPIDNELIRDVKLPNSASNAAMELASKKF